MKSHALLAIAVSMYCLAVGKTLRAAEDDASRPNILWITSEDNGPHLGCYGDKFATTPHLDQLAARGMLYRYCWSNAPVCAPARTTIISGLYPTCTGAEHMRSMTKLPNTMKMYPAYLREAGYYCTNNSKEDYNLEKVGPVWDDSSPKAHWRNRPDGKPFFSIFNFTVSHESQIRKRPHKPVHDAEHVRVPAYHPDAPEVRRDWAQYYDKLTEMDGQVAATLRELTDDGLSDDTIVFYYGDHGPGMPRNKRWPYNSGLHVPLIVYFPPKYMHLAPDEFRAGGASERLVSFIDLAPTVISLAGVEPPSHLQGSAFAGEFESPAPEYLYGFRGRMDERYDMVRSLRDDRFVYIRHFMPHKIYGQHVAYMFETPTTRTWKRLFVEGKLTSEQDRFWQTKPSEELYDLHSDPDEVHNLAASPEHRDTLVRMRAALHDMSLEIRDVGFLPEAELHARSGESSPYEMGHDEARYPIERILVAAELATDLSQASWEPLLPSLEHPDAAVRYWGAIGLLVRGENAVRSTDDNLRKMLADKSPSVQIAAAEALGRFGKDEDSARACSTLVELSDLNHHDLFVVIAALNVLDQIAQERSSRTKWISERTQSLPRTVGGTNGRLNSYVPRLLEHIAEISP